jgi:hypothetical protein
MAGLKTNQQISAVTAAVMPILKMSVLSNVIVMVFR